MTATLPSAAFFAAGRYHHHIAANTWLGTDIAPALPEDTGLNHFSVVLPGKEEFERTLEQLSHRGLPVTDLSGGSAFVHDADGIRVRIQT
jgi:catechol 2,3-dioxygenase